MTVGKELFPRKSWGSKGSTSQQFFRPNTYSKLLFCGISLLLWLVHGKFHLCQTNQGKLNCRFHQLELWDSNSATVSHWQLGTILPPWERHQIQYNIHPHTLEATRNHRDTHCCSLEREMSGWRRFLSRKGLLQAVADNTALHAQSSQQNRTPCSNLVFPNIEVQNFVLHLNFWCEWGSQKGS